MDPSTPPRILIVRLSALGDIVQAQEALELIHPHLPPIHWTWAVSEPYTCLIEGKLGVDSIIPVPRKWSWSRWKTFKKEQGHHRFDLVIDAQCLLKSFLVRLAIKKCPSLTWGPQQSRDWLSPRLAQHRLDRAPTSARQATIELLLRGLEILKLPLPQDLPRNFSQRILRSDFRIVCSIGAGWPTKQISPEAWEKLLQAIRRDCPDREIVFIPGVGREKEELENMWPKLEAFSVVQNPSLGLAELKSWFREGDLFIGMDSGPTHLAAAQGLITFSFFGPSMPEAYDRHGAGPQAPRGACHLKESFEKRCDQLRHCQSCSALTSIDVQASWQAFWERHAPELGQKTSP